MVNDVSTIQSCFWGDAPWIPVPEEKNKSGGGVFVKVNWSEWVSEE